MDTNAYNDLIKGARAFITNSISDYSRQQHGTDKIESFRSTHSHLYNLVQAWEDWQTGAQVRAEVAKVFGGNSASQQAMIADKVAELLPHMPLRAAINFIAEVLKTRDKIIAESVGAVLDQIQNPIAEAPEFTFPCVVTRENYIALARYVKGKDHDSHGVCITLNRDRGATVYEGQLIYEHNTAAPGVKCYSDVPPQTPK